MRKDITHACPWAVQCVDMRESQLLAARRCVSCMHDLPEACGYNHSL